MKTRYCNGCGNEVKPVEGTDYFYCFTCQCTVEEDETYEEQSL